MTTTSRRWSVLPALMLALASLTEPRVAGRVADHTALDPTPPIPLGQTAAPPPQDPQTPVFRSGVKLVLVDVSVTGADDQPLTDLAVTDFELTEDGLAQKVEQAQLIQLDGQPRGGAEALEIRSQDHALAEAGRDDVRIFAIFMDDYHLDKFPQEMQPLKKGLSEFLGPMMGPQDLVTVMNPITPLSALVWTRDRDKLIRGIKIYEGRMDNFIGRSVLEESQNYTRNIFRVRSQVVISALQALVMHLSGLREGRKTILFVSRGIPLLFDISLETEFSAMLREANRGNVIIHTLDPRGLGQGISVHDTLYRMASETGGQAIVNTNDLSRGLRRVVQDASHHYLLGYAPTREINDGKFHRIVVKVKRKGAHAVSRKGYWSPTVEEMTPKTAEAIEPAVSGAITTLQARRDDRVVHVETGFAKGPAGMARMTTMWRPVAGFKDRTERLLVEARAEGGASFASTESTVAPDGAGVATLDVPAGAVTIRFTAHGASGDVVDRWEVAITVPDMSGATMAISTPAFVRARTTAAFQALRRGDAGVPSPDREFHTTDLVVVRASVSVAEGDAPQVVADVLTRQGKVLVSLPTTVIGGVHQVDLPVRSLALGEYVLRFVASRGAQGATISTAFALVR